MTTSTIYEIIGYIASVLVAISLTMSSILRLRIINLIGAVFFTAYGLLIRAYPVAAVNFFIVLIDLYYLYQMLSTREFFHLLEVRPDSEYLRAFIDYYTKDIHRFQPNFSFTPTPGTLALFVLRNMVPAGLVLGQIRDEQCLYIQLDYAIPGYRDLKIARFVYQDQAEVLRKHGIRKICTEAGAPAHARYLERIGFKPETDPGGEGQYCLVLEAP